MGGIMLSFPVFFEPKAKTPRRCSAVLALGESSSEAFETIKRPAHCHARPHSTH
jgi:hypothetical protein